MAGNALFCSHCSKTFCDSFALKDHHRRNHRALLLSCDHCPFTTKFNFHLSNHISKNHINLSCHPRQHGHAGTKSRKVAFLTCPLCTSFQCQDRSEMIQHYVTVHDVDLTEKLIDFSDAEEFSRWKKETEASGSFRFVKNTTNENRDNVVKYFRCFRDGFFQSSGQGKRRLKIKGSCKTNGVCPCSLKVTSSKITGRVTVSYISRHVGHTVDIGRMNLTKEERLSIEQKLSQHVPVDVILDTSDEEPMDTGDLVIGERGDDLEAEVVKHLSAKNRAASSSSCRDIGRAKEGLSNKFSDILKLIENMDGVEVVNKALAPIIPTLQALASGLVFKPHGDSKNVNPCAKISPQKTLYSTKKARKNNENSLSKPSHEEREKLA